ncbi:MAG: radical protein [Clostridia bacterium]|jgi:putative pyruvate formate lyase activating enzyme|nr:radical protein [Clostridia bacterium]
MLEVLKTCHLCPRKCGVDRLKGELGYCNAGGQVKIARAALHYWEEPCLSGENGSGTVFFSHCTLKCIFCQNHQISTKGMGKEISIEELAQIFLRLQQEGAHNINLVTPAHYVPQIIEALKLAKFKGLNLPIVYNSSGYETLETLQMLEGYIDVYLPDFKYFKEAYATRYSNAPCYAEYAKAAIKEMVRQAGETIFTEGGMMQRGVIVRHLMLPGLLFDSKKVVKYIHETYDNRIYISIMNQYTPLSIIKEHLELNRVVNPKHYDFIIDYALEIGIENGFFQEGETASESFIPEFSGQ